MNMESKVKIICAENSMPSRFFFGNLKWTVLQQLVRTIFENFNLNTTSLVAENKYYVNFWLTKEEEQM